ncbi:alpha-glucosidase II precursor [Violaceomyces palustris]|uniref:Alpha-glucosidase II n=1 Tax=Violaceomyces palustris TaxID=1673888 RepID=A0ACD0P7D6_9BASI|nr:alpha-glucosidase II precursor [Violaceomyces palustris]
MASSGDGAKGRAASPSSTRPLLLLLLSLLLSIWSLSSLAPASAVRYHDFKKCKDSSLCTRFRRLSDYVESNHPFRSPYSITQPPATQTPPPSPSFDPLTSTLTYQVHSALHPTVQFQLNITAFQDGTSRIRMDQVGDTYKGWKRYDEAAKWGIEKLPELASQVQVESLSEPHLATKLSFGPSRSSAILLQHDPLKIEILRDGHLQLVLNDRGLLHMEHFRPKPDPFPTPDDAAASDSPQQSLVFQERKRSILSSSHSSSYQEDQVHQWAGFEREDPGEWEETWSQRKDSKPKGPEGVGLDMTFPGYSHLYGLPEHASPLSLRSTRSPRGQKEGEDEQGRFDEPYRLMNTDVFEYDHDSPMALYGSVPVLHAQSQGSSVSIFWLSGSETWIDLHKTPYRGDPSLRRKAGISHKSSHAHFFSESGVLDLFIFPGPSASTIMSQFTSLVGRTAMPQYFAIGYHQCRWNYLTDGDVKDVNHRFDDEDIPMDVLWLDIEYSKDHMYGVWDEVAFKDPEGMVKDLDDRGRKLVIIIDPHLKRTRDYYLYAEAQDKQLLVRTSDGQGEYEGWCWSGSASWLDMFSPESWKWWSEQFALTLKKGVIGAGEISGKLRANARNVFVWNDMNEPAIFNGPEVTSPKDVIHHGGWEHRDLHNINGILFHNATARGLEERELSLPGGVRRRPFVLSRSWWVGTQKYGAIWTGDNLGTWEHLAVSVPMILANGMGGMSFCGADIGGFFGNPEPDMLVRWYQAGIWEPFFRAHAHIDTKRREPYLLEEPLRSAVRDLIKLRYKLLPAWYTAFKESRESGLPILRPQYLMFPDDVKGFDVDDQYYVGDTGLLVKPAVQKDIDSVDVYLAEDKPYYNYFSHELYLGSSVGQRVKVPAPLTSEMPVLLRGGSILPVRERVRRAAELGWKDPFTLVVALDKKRVSDKGDGIRAQGSLYLDDGQTYEFEKGTYIWKRLRWVGRPEGSSDQGEVLESLDEEVVRPVSARFDAHTAVTVDGSENTSEYRKLMADVRVERILVLGLEKEPKRIRVQGRQVRGKEREQLLKGRDWTWESGKASSSTSGKILGSGSGGVGVASRLWIKDPAVIIAEDWKIFFD